MLYVLSLPVIVALVFGAILFQLCRDADSFGERKNRCGGYSDRQQLIQIIKILHDADLVQNRFLFHVLVTVKGGARIGSRRSMNLPQRLRLPIWREASSWRHQKYPVTIYEDSSLSQVALRLQEKQIDQRKGFFELSQDAEFLSELGIRSSSMEGYLFPDTYFLDRSMTTRRIMRMDGGTISEQGLAEMIRQAAQKA